jgi:hypothetical protein
MRGPQSRPYLGLILFISIPILVLVACAFCLLLLARFQLTGDKAGLLIGLVGGLLLTTVLILWTLGKRLRAQGLGRQGAGGKAQSDPRPHLLYLRSFQDDQTSLTATDTREESIVAVMKEIGPVVAIGRPGDSLAPLGAERRYCKEDDWKDEVVSLVKQARLVVIQAGASSGLLWEISEATKRLRSEQLLISLRNKDSVLRRSANQSAQDQYDEFRALTSQFFRLPLPDRLDDATFMWFAEDWKPQLLRPVRWKPYNLSPTAKIRETLRPFFERQDARLSRLRTMVQGILMSLLMVLGMVLVVGGLWVSFLLVASVIAGGFFNPV